MLRWNGPAKIKELKSPTVVTIGNFDGLHLGHRELLRRARQLANSSGAQCLALTFEPHPACLLDPQRDLKRLYDISDLEVYFSLLGVDILLIENFTAEFAALSAQEFIELYLCKSLKIKGLVVGHDFRFGAGRQGDVAVLEEYGVKLGFKVVAVPPVLVNEQTVSSSLIRQCLAAGRVHEVIDYLGRPYDFRGEVVHGDSRGKRLGFPTANINPRHSFLPALGVYAGTFRYKNTDYPCVINVGKRPTFTGKNSKVSFEVHVLGQKMNLYGAQVQVFLEHRLREELKFSSQDELIKQINQDISKARELLKV